MIRIKLEYGEQGFRTTTSFGEGGLSIQHPTPVVFETTEGHEFAVNFADAGIEIHTVGDRPRSQWVSIQPDHVSVLAGNEI